MSHTTPVYALPYPDPTDPADVPHDVQALANRLEVVLPTVGQAGVPVGGGIDWYAASPPSGFLLCDGSAISRTTYAALFGILGTIWGPGDGSTTFNLPDTRGRVIVGFAPGGHADVATIGANDGAALASRRPRHGHTNGVTAGHTLSLPQHAHGISDPGHAHGVSDPGHYHGKLAGGSNQAGTTWQYNNVASTDVPKQDEQSVSREYTGIGIYAAGTGISVGGITSAPAINGGVQIGGTVGVTGPTDCPSYTVAAKAIKT